MPDHPVHELITKRWSPYAYSNKLIPPDDLRSIFEAARWAASSFNEQPWRYIVTKRDDEEAFAKALSCLMESNQPWAKECGALGFGCVSTTFARNGKTNRVAEHDLGLATGNLTLEATKRGVYIHQLGGIYVNKVKEVFGLPEGFVAVTGIALGYLDESGNAPEEIQKRDAGERKRRPLGKYVFGTAWGSGAL